MRVSLNWIKRLLDLPALPLPVAELQKALTLRVAEFESEVEVAGPALAGVVVGKVLTCGQHPGADRLRVTTVDIGRGAPVPIVCGAPNVAAGQTVAVATIGTTLTMPGKDGAPATITIKAAKLRGEPSEGMICAADELGLPGGHDGILVLDAGLPAGTPLREALGLGDSVLVIENAAITHRPDLWGQWGWAREIAAILGVPPPAPLDTAWAVDAGPWRADLRSDGCTAYAGAVVDGVANTPSPAWMQDLLTSVGVRPLGLLVDLTNYVMLEVGEPLHAFDRRDLDGTTVVVRDAAAGEAFTTLDGRRHTLAGDDVVIADGERALALAGIMGGAGSMVRADTSGILLEAAIFKAARIRRTRQARGVATDSSARFEKTLYPEGAPAALNRTLALLRELCPGCRVVQRFASGALAGAPVTLTLPADAVPRLTGLAVDAAARQRLLGALGFAVAGDAVTVPWWRRKDVGCTADLVEEVARSHGYGLIQPETPRLPAAAPALNPLRSAEHRARRVLSAQGWSEVATYAFTSAAWAAALGWDPAATVGLAHPLSSEQTVMRQSLLPTLAEAVGRNRKHRGDVAIYEVGKVYGVQAGAGDTAHERVVVAGMRAAAGEEAPFYAARDAALALLRGLGHEATYAPRSAAHAELAPDRAVDLLVAGAVVGVAGELPRPLRARADCPERVGYFGLELERLVAAQGAPKPVAHHAPSRFPLVEREYTWVCPEALPYGDLATATRQAAGALCAGIELITIYRGEQIGAAHKAVSLRVRLQAAERTLEEKDLQQLHGRIVKSVEARTAAKLRA